MYKVIGAVIYNVIDEYICIYYPGLIQEKLSKNDNNFKNTVFKDLSGLVIPDILMKIMPCHGFVKYSISTVILTCRNSLFPCYLSKGFFIVEIEVGVVDNITIIVKNQGYSFTQRQESSNTKSGYNLNHQHIEKYHCNRCV